LAELHPEYAIIENVSRLVSDGLDEVLWSLYQIGYGPVEPDGIKIISAKDMGAPHQRNRIWIVVHPVY
jgi:DNA (cytosine-5)-methyltransferase 1